MPVEVVGLSSVGGREANQDAWASLELAGGGSCVVLADGAGGHRGGEVASRLAVEAALATLREHAAAPLKAVGMAVLCAHAAVQTHARAHPDVQHMRTTLVVLAIHGGRAAWAHVGDSRLYLWRDGDIASRTRDHSVPEMLLGLGKLEDEDEMRRHPDRSRLLRALGGDDEVRPAVQEPAVELRGGERFLLCSDGLWEAHARDELARRLAVAERGTVVSVVEGLVDDAVEAAGDGADNTTCVVVLVPRSARAPVDSSTTECPPRRRASAMGREVRLAWMLALCAVAVVAAAGAGAAWFLVAREIGPEPACARLVALASTSDWERYLEEEPRGRCSATARRALTPRVVREGEHLQEVLAGLPSGAVVALHPGRFRESLVLTRPVRLRAAEGGSASIEGVDGPALSILARDVEVIGLRLGGPDPSVVVAGALVVHEDASAWVRGGRISGSAGDGVLVEGELTLEDTVVTAHDGAGIVLSGPAATLTATRVSSSRNGHEGLLVGRGRASLEECTVEENGGVGVRVVEGTLEARDLRVVLNTGMGLAAVGAEVEADDLVVVGTLGDGLWVSGGTLRLRRARSSANEGAGVRSLGAASVALTDITVVENAGAGLFLSSCSEVRISREVLRDNGAGDIVATPDCVLAPEPQAPLESQDPTEAPPVSATESNGSR